MFENEFALIFKAFCEGYKGMVSYLGMVSPEEKKYRIQVNKESLKDNDEEIKINLCIYDTKYDRGFNTYFERDRQTNNLNYLSIVLLIKKEYYEHIITHFIDDFYSNHKVLFSSYGTLESCLNVHNTHFELCIKCNNDYDRAVAEARKTAINKRIERDSNNKSNDEREKENNLEINPLSAFKSFCEGYNGVISYLGMISPENTKYRIEISKHKLYDKNKNEIDDKYKINFCIYDTRYDRGYDKLERDRLTNNLNYLSTSMIVSKEYYQLLINQFIENFYANHVVTHASVDTLGSRIAIHNTHFELCIKYDKSEREWAENMKTSFNERLRRDSNISGYCKPLCKVKKPE